MASREEVQLQKELEEIIERANQRLKEQSEWASRASAALGKVAGPARALGDVVKGQLTRGAVDARGAFDGLTEVVGSLGPKGQIAAMGMKAVAAVVDIIDARTRKLNQAVNSAFASVIDGSKSAGQALEQIKLDVLADGFKTLGEEITKALNPDTFTRFMNAANPVRNITDVFAGQGAFQRVESFGQALRTLQASAQAPGILEQVLNSPQGRQARATVGVTRANMRINDLAGRNVESVEGGQIRERGVLEQQATANQRSMQLNVLGRTAQEVADEMTRLAQVEQLARETGISFARAQEISRDRMLQLAAAQARARETQEANNIALRNRTFLEQAQVRLRSLREGIRGGLNEESAAREAGNIFNQLRQAVGPLERLAPIMEEGSASTLSAIRKAEAEQRGADPATQMVELQRAALEMARQQTEYGRAAAQALQNLSPAGV